MKNFKLMRAMGFVLVLIGYCGTTLGADSLVKQAENKLLELVVPDEGDADEGDADEGDADEGDAGVCKSVFAAGQILLDLNTVIQAMEAATCRENANKTFLEIIAARVVQWADLALADLIMAKHGYAIVAGKVVAAADADADVVEIDVNILAAGKLTILNAFSDGFVKDKVTEKLNAEGDRALGFSSYITKTGAMVTSLWNGICGWVNGSVEKVSNFISSTNVLSDIAPASENANSMFGDGQEEEEE